MLHYYQVGGSLTKDAPCYVKRQADSQLYTLLKAGTFCYILNSRQMGKSSLLVRTQYRLQQEGFRCATLDLSCIGSEIITPTQWYKGIISELSRSFGLLGKFNLKSWWRDEEDISLLQKLNKFIIDVLLVQFPEERLFIFIDEIDSILSLDFPVDDIFALVRFCYNQRTVNPEYKRITFAIFGVATPSDLIRNRKRTPFNIGKAIELNGFEIQEIQPLIRGLEVEKGLQVEKGLEIQKGLEVEKGSKIQEDNQANAVIEKILYWTGGQPFLTQKLCELVVALSKDTVTNKLTIPPGTEDFWVEGIVWKYIIQKWESQDEPEHFRTIRNRLLQNQQIAGRLLGIYQQILEGLEVVVDDSWEQIELLLSGLVIKENDLLKVKNPIYQEVFNIEWVANQLGNLRPYSQAFEAWIASQEQDQSRLLRGQALLDAQKWAQGKSLSNLDYRFLAASQQFDRKEMQQALEAEKLKEVEARLVEEQKRLIQEKKSARIKTLFSVLVSFAFLSTLGFGVTAFLQYRRAAINEIKAIAISSEALFSSNQKQEALIESIRAMRLIERLGNVDASVEAKVEQVLRQNVYGRPEYNRLLGHDSGVKAIAVSPDGKIIASASDDKTVKLWNFQGKLLKTLKHRRRVRTVTFSPNGKLVASGCKGNAVKIWTIDGKLLTVMKHDEDVEGLGFSPDGHIIASSSRDKTIKLWNLDGKLLTTIRGHSDRVDAVEFNPQGNLLVSASKDKTVKIWTSNGKLLKTLKHEERVFDVTFSPNGQLIASASGDGTIRIWSIDGKLVKTLKGHFDSVNAVSFSPNGQLIASSGWDKSIILWSIDGKHLETFEGHSSGFSDVVFSPVRVGTPQGFGHTLIASSLDKTVKLWKLNENLFYYLRRHSGDVTAVAFSPDSKLIVSGGRDGMVKLWQPNGKLIRTLKSGKPSKSGKSSVLDVAISPDGQMIASSNANRIMNIWDINGSKKQTIKGYRGNISALEFSPDGKILASSSVHKSIQLWKLDGSLVANITGHHDVSGLAFSPDGKIIASVSKDKTIKLWSLNGTLIRTLKGHNDSVTSVAFGSVNSGSGKELIPVIVSGSLDKTVKLWQVDGQLLHTFKGHTDHVRTVAISPDGQIIASGSTDNTLKLWKIDGSLLAAIWKDADVYDIAFSPNNKMIVWGTGRDDLVVLPDIEFALNRHRLLSYACNLLRDYLKNNPEVNARSSAFYDYRKSPVEENDALFSYAPNNSTICDGI